MIEIRDVYKQFGEKEVLKGVSAHIERGEVFTIIGPSGQGKSTLLRLINLLDKPTSGSILFEGVDIHQSRDQQAIRRKMAMVFQKPVVFSTTVYENIAYGLHFRRSDRANIKRQVDHALEVIDMVGFADRKAKSLSGGEMQRVALARAMVTEPELLLLDEPTANLDPLATHKIEELVRHYNRESHTTVIMSTHDMQQGQRLASRIAVMMHGKFAQVGTPRDVFASPSDREVANFVGVKNILTGTITSNSEGLAMLAVEGVSIEAVTPLPVGTPVWASILPEDITLLLSHGRRTSARNVFPGRVVRFAPRGPLLNVTVDCGIELSATVTWKSAEDLGLKVGDEVRLSFKASAVHVMDDSVVLPQEGNSSGAGPPSGKPSGPDRPTWTHVST
jgi:tungstate transport system ATP-binding protein